jgi:hypothetical protein
MRIMPKGIDDLDRAKALPVVQVLAEKRCAIRLGGGGEVKAVPPAETLIILQAPSSLCRL